MSDQESGPVETCPCDTCVYKTIAATFALMLTGTEEGAADLLGSVLGQERDRRSLSQSGRTS